MRDHRPDEIIRAELGRDERILWAGCPAQGLRLRAADAFMIPFSILWGGFAIFWEASVIRIGAPLFMVLFGVPFVLVGLYLIFGRFFFDAWRRARTFYGVTSERVVIVTELFGRTVKSLNLDTLTDVSLSERASGAGTITYGPVPPMYAWYAGGGWPMMGFYTAPSFELAEAAREVYETVRGAQRAARQLA